MKTCVLTAFLFFLGLAHAEEPQNFTYRCRKKGEGTLYLVSEKNKTQIAEYNEKEQKTKEYPLPSALRLLDSPREPILFLYGPSFELREQFVHHTNPEQIKLALIRERKLLKGWLCSFSGVAMAVRMIESEAENTSADKLWLLRAVKGVVNQDTLNEKSQAMVIDWVERYALIKKDAEGVFFKKLVLAVGEPLLYLSSGMVREINSHLSEAGKETWKAVLALLSFDQFAPMQRWIFWAQLVALPNNEAFRMAVREFAESPLFVDANMRSFFQKETKGVLSNISLEQFQQLKSSGLDKKAQEFLDKLWAERKQ